MRFLLTIALACLSMGWGASGASASSESPGRTDAGPNIDKACSHAVSLVGKKLHWDDVKIQKNLTECVRVLKELREDKVEPLVECYLAAVSADDVKSCQRKLDEAEKPVKGE